MYVYYVEYFFVHFKRPWRERKLYTRFRHIIRNVPINFKLCLFVRVIYNRIIVIHFQFFLLSPLLSAYSNWPLFIYLWQKTGFSVLSLNGEMTRFWLILFCALVQQTLCESILEEKEQLRDGNNIYNSFHMSNVLYVPKSLRAMVS
jgi:hypothetical protein